ncbi:AraC family transcriptional regulator [Sphingobacterium bovistauri]|uniref:Helix-turn-helix domain-containing protein n=1 Tax=Sphingobacterium bovistauri TaxID=2781959 RepID=A0ABS7Z061_9SPHI|nr:AraC family transcriptional regulator [Sphingobacterium bovistauri]MCA5003555.1 helix-turn-helix domain-containing protein [Sphingobacterium bovistauri]
MRKLSLTDNFKKCLHTRRDTYPQHHNLWHYHEEVEFIYLAKGTGTLFVGDCIQTVAENSAVLIGSNLPHYWLFDNDYLNEYNPIDCLVVHFKPNFLGDVFHQLDETKTLQEIISNSEKGIYLENCSEEFAKLFQRIIIESDILKITKLIESLIAFHSCSPVYLASDSYEIYNHSLDTKRMNEVISYIKDNYREKVDLEDLANLAKMTKNSFCRYFKQKTGKTPIQFVSELRVSHACRLLRSSEMNLKEICYESGFNNFVNFHKIFKAIIKTSPIQYKKSN